MTHMRQTACLVFALVLLFLTAAPAWAGWRQDIQQAQQTSGRGSLDQAIGLYERAAADPAIPNSTKATVYYNLGNLYMKKKPSLPLGQRSAYEKKALTAYTRAVTLDPGYAKAYNNRGNVHRVGGSLNRALGDYTLAIKADPKYAPAWRNRSIVYEKRDRLSEAVSDAQTYLRLQPGDSREQQRLAKLKQELASQQKKAPEAMRLAQAGQAAMKRRDYKKALDLFNKAIVLRAMTPHGQSRTYANQGTCWYHLGHYAKAAQSYRLALIIDPKFAGAYRDRGIAYIRLKDYDRAVLNFTSAINYDPKLASAYYHRALAYWSLKDYARAKRDLTRYLKMQPGDARAQRILKEIKAGQPANYQ